MAAGKAEIITTFAFSVGPGVPRDEKPDLWIAPSVEIEVSKLVLRTFIAEFLRRSKVGPVRKRNSAV